LLDEQRKKDELERKRAFEAEKLRQQKEEEEAQLRREREIEEARQKAKRDREMKLKSDMEEEISFHEQNFEMGSMAMAMKGRPFLGINIKSPPDFPPVTKM
jgi:cell division septum initiation protein DivIVA